ncbi:winged helix-turn-helix transcriptional regulator [Microlunatus flavus]|uniref:DNA-binding transcriptional regulator, HxlR family n=1 Tax=Microlunatus flavus TaxID=1036181 RepID=A0A1H9FUX6_9ACTN|nr:helix-turn-helix domain-containing protein [Microlunatus flavus]SEQ41705.1 DNA-binding transcriptional regulator, HxlR family [Microlunatus flavus]
MTVRADAPSTTPPTPIDDEACRAFQDVVELIGRRWNGAILLALARGHSRFGDIRAQVDGLSDRLLSQRLKQLDDAGLVRRTVVPTTPVQVLYELTDRGLRLITALQPLVRYGVTERAATRG